MSIDMKTRLLTGRTSILGTLIFISLISLTTSVSEQVLTKSLHDYLFTDYDTNLLPICNEGENVTVRIDLALRQVMELNEPGQILTTNVWIRLTWDDCRLSWNQSAYGNITDITVLYDNIWFPDITLYDSAAEEVMFPDRDSYRATITSTGSISYNFPTVLTSICRVNVRYFPFDTQRCPLRFGSWSYHGLHLDVVNKNPSGDLDSYVENNEWDLQELPATRRVFFYNCCIEPYSDVTFYVILQRLPAFYVLTMLFPCILVTFVSALTFLLPTESGEKVSLEITVLLSLAVFLLVVSEALPPASHNFPIIGYYFAAAMVLVSVSLLQTIIIVNVFHHGTNGRRVPGWLKTACFKYIARVVLVKPNPSVNKVYHTDEKLQAWKECSSVDTCTFIDLESNGEINPGSSETDDVDDNHVIQNGVHEFKQFKEDGKKLRFHSRTLPPSLENPTVKLLRDQNEKLDVIVARMKQKSHQHDINAEWRDVANVLDRVFLLFYCLLTIITTLALLLQCVY